ncbi:MAG: NAD(P)H-hydrate dehydratase [Halanaerobiales bacterium]
MIVLKPEEMRRVDESAIEAGFPDLLLMETAGRGVAEKARLILEGEIGHGGHIDHSNDGVHSHQGGNQSSVQHHSLNNDGKVLIIAGKGNNGGDGLVAARYLDIWGYHVKILLLAEEGELTGSPELNLKLCKLRDIEIEAIIDDNEGVLSEAENLIYRADLVIDAMLGTGIKGEVREPYASLIDMINQYVGSVLAVDIPSGVDGENGAVLGNAVIADYTMTMAYPKIGLVVYPGREHCGEVEIIDLGVPVDYVLEQEPEHFVLDIDEAGSLLPQRPVDSHKGTFGKVGIIGGSSGMAGAPSMTGLAALKIGAGLVQLAVPEIIEPTVASFSPEMITIGLKGMENLLKVDDLNLIEKLIGESTVMAVGPGLGVSDSTTRVVTKILEEFDGPLVLDADGINSLDSLEVLDQRGKPLIMTPHPGEMARLVDREIKEIQSNRIGFAREFATEHNIHLVLKGAATVIALPDGDIYINTSGNEGMATAGSGDVLTGMITGLLAMGLDIGDAVILGTFLHGLAGDAAAFDLSSYSMTASDIISYIPEAIRNIQ